MYQQPCPRPSLPSLVKVLTLNMESAKTLCISPSELKLKRGADVTHRLDLDIFFIKKKEMQKKKPRAKRETETQNP